MNLMTQNMHYGDIIYEKNESDVIANSDFKIQ